MITSSSVYNVQPPAPQNENLPPVQTSTPINIEELETYKSLNVTSVEDAKEKVSDIEVFGNGDTWQLLCKASSKSQGWMKSTKVLEIPHVGCLVQVSTQQGTNIAEAVTFVPNVILKEDDKGNKYLTYWR